LLRLIAGLIDYVSCNLPLHGRDATAQPSDVALLLLKGAHVQSCATVKNMLLPLKIGRTFSAAHRKTTMDYHDCFAPGCRMLLAHPATWGMQPW